MGHLREPVVEFDWNYLEPRTKDPVSSVKVEPVNSTKAAHQAAKTLQGLIGHSHSSSSVAGRALNNMYNYSNGPITGRTIGHIVHDEFWMKDGSESPERAADYKGLSVDEWRWAVAMRKVLGVGEKFYETATPDSRRKTEQNIKDTAQHKSSKGQRARRILARHAEMTLMEDAPRVEKSDYDGNPQSIPRADTGRHQLPAYKALWDNMLADVAGGRLKPK